MPAASTDPNIQIEFVQADVLTHSGEAILVPAFSDGRMEIGFPARVKKAGGAVVEELAVKSAPIAVGAALVSPGGKLKVAHIIHSPLVEQDGMRVGVENIRRCVRAGLLAASHFKFEQIAIPGMGYGDGGVPFDEAARAIIDEIRAYKATPPTLAVLMDDDEEMAAAFSLQLNQ